MAGSATQRAGKRAAEYAKALTSMPSVNPAEADECAADMLAHFERSGEKNPYALQQELQDTMQNLVGIIRTGSELDEALEKIQTYKERAQHTSVEGNKQYNPGWHLATGLRSLLTVSEATALAALERKDRRGAQTRDDYPQTDPEFGKRRQPPVPEMTMRVFRGNGSGGTFVDYQVEVEEGNVVLDLIHRIPATQANDLAVRWNCRAGK